MENIEVRKTLKERGWLKFNPKESVYFIDLFRNGKRLRKTITDESSPMTKVSKTRAIEIGDKIVADWLRQAKPEAEKMTFKDCTDLVLKAMKIGLRPATFAKADGVYRLHLNPFFGRMNIREVNSVEWTRYVELEKKKNPDVVLSEKLKYLLKVLRWAHGEAIVERVPVIRLPRSSKPKFEGTALTDDERARLLAAEEGDISLIVRLALSTGMRRNEMIDLEWWQLEKKPGWIVLPDEKVKTWKGREVPLTEELHKALISRPKVARFVFHEPGKDKAWGGCRTAWDKLKKTCAVRSKVRFHDLRHDTLSRKLSVEKKNPLLICRAAGLDPKVALNVYVHPTDDDLRNEFLG